MPSESQELMDDGPPQNISKRKLGRDNDGDPIDPKRTRTAIDTNEMKV